MHPDLDRLASSQHGLVTSAQLRALGFSKSSIRQRLRWGWLCPVRPFIYRLQGCPPTWEQAVEAALLAAGAGAVASHQTAGRLWAFPGIDRPGTIELTATRWLRLSGIRPHQSEYLGGQDVTCLRRLRVTTPARTLCDLGGAVPTRLLGTMADFAIREGLCRLDDIQRCAARLPHTRANHPLRPVRRLLEDRYDGPLRGDSELEGRAFRALRAAGMPDPVAQYRVRFSNKVYLLDMAYPEARIGIELDGWAFHGTRSAFDADRIRANALRNADWHLLQFTSNSADADIVATVGEALALRATLIGGTAGRLGHRTV